MDKKKNEKTTGLAESFSLIFTNFGQALSEIFNDPELKEKAREFGSSAATSAGAFASRFKDEEVRDKFEKVGDAAKEFGNNIARSSREWASKTGGSKSSQDSPDGSGPPVSSNSQE